MRGFNRKHAPETDRLRALAPQMEAMGFAQRQPVRETDRLRALAPKMAAMGYPQRFADGGLVPKKPRQAKGPLARGFDMETARMLNEQPDSVPAMVKPGEYVLPPDTVAAVGGPQALDVLVDETHTPGNQEAVVPEGFEPQMFFARPGLVDDEEKRRSGTVASGNQRAHDVNARARAVGLPDFPRVATPEAQKAIDEAAQARDQALAPRPNIQQPDPVSRDQVQAAYQDWADKRSPWYLPTPRSDTAARSAEANYEDTLRKYQKGAGTGPLVGGPSTVLAGGDRAAAQQPASQAAIGAVNQQAPGDATMPAQDFVARGFAQAGQASQAGLAQQTENNITKTVGPDGRVTYSGQNIGPNATINGQTPGGGYMEVPAGAGYGPARGFNVPGAGSYMNAENARMAANLRDGLPLRAGLDGNGPSVVTVGTSPEEARQSRLREQMMRTAASGPMYGNARQNAPYEEQRKAAMDWLRSDAGFQASQNRDAASLEQERIRSGAREAGEDRRAQAQAARDDRRFELDERRLAGEEKAQGFVTREAQRRQGILERYDSARDDAERNAIAQQYPDVFGRPERDNMRDRFMAYNLGKDSMGNDLGQGIMDLTTGRPVGGQAQQVPDAPSSKKDRIAGQIYMTPTGPRVWYGESWGPVVQ